MPTATGLHARVDRPGAGTPTCPTSVRPAVRLPESTAPTSPSTGTGSTATSCSFDPYAKAVTGPILWSDELFGYTIGDPAEDLSFDARDSAAGMPKGQVIDPAFTWGDDRAPKTPWNRTVIYEAHVRG